MRVLTIIALVALSIGNPQPAPAHSPKEKCEEVKQKIRKIESKMRQGYTAREGVRMEDELRRLRSIRSKSCR